MLLDLICLRCGTPAPWTGSVYLCERCGTGSGPEDAGVLDARYDYDAARAELLDGRTVKSRRTDVFRWLPLLPPVDASPSLPVGGTPLVPAPRIAAALGVGRVLLKDETRNPTRALKDRATAVALGRARLLGATELHCASAGNAAISLAGFCAAAGLRSHAFVPAAASETRLHWLRRFGATIHRSSGDYDQAYVEAEEARVEHGWYSRNCAYNPFLVEGKKTVGLEIAEQLEWESPDMIVCAVGDGCTLGAVGKAFREVLELGLVERLPQLVGAQADAIQPIVEELRRRNGESPAADGSLATETSAASIAVRHPHNVQRLLAEVECSGGTMLAVSDAETAEAQAQLAREAGVVAEFTSATTLAALRRLAAEEDLRDQTVVLIVTGGRADDA